MPDTLEDITPQDFWDLAPVLSDDSDNNEIVTVRRAVNVSSTFEPKESVEKEKESFPYADFLINQDHQSSAGMKGKNQLIQGLKEEEHSNLGVKQKEHSWPEIKEKKQSNIELKDASCKADKKEMWNQAVRKKIRSHHKRSSKSGKKQKQADCKLNEKHSGHENKDGKPSYQLLTEDWQLGHQRNEIYQTSQGINDHMYFHGARNAMHQPMESNIDNGNIELVIIPVLTPGGKHGRGRRMHIQFLCFYIYRPVPDWKRKIVSWLCRAYNKIDILLFLIFCFVIAFYIM